MKNLFFSLLLLLYIFGKSFAQQNNLQENFFAAIQFDSSSFASTPFVENQLHDLLTQLHQDFLKKIYIHAYCDTTNLADRNLYNNRSKTIMSYLIAANISSEKIAADLSDTKNINRQFSNKEASQAIELEIINETDSFVNPLNYYRSSPGVQTVDADNEIYMEGEQGTKIAFQQNSFMDKNGKEVHGNIQIAMMEFYRKSDFLLNGLTTASDGKLLESGGTIYVEAKQNNELLQLKSNSNFEIAFKNPSTSAKKMQTFLGVINNQQVNWKLQPLIQKALIKTKQTPPKPILEGDGGEYWGVDSISQSSSSRLNGVYEGNRIRVMSIDPNDKAYTLLQSTKLGWINCDRFNESQNLITMNVNADERYKARTFLIFDEIKSVIEAQNYGSAMLQFYRIPQGMKATVVAVSIKNNQPYMAIKKITIDNKNKVALNFKPSTLEQIKLTLQTFD